MINVKETKSGNIAIIVGKEYKDVAMRIFMQAGAEILTGELSASAEESVRTLSDIKGAVESVGVGRPKMILNPRKVYNPEVKSVEGLDAEKQGNEVISILADKMPNYHHSKLRTFYTDLERDTGAGIYRMHKELKNHLKISEVGKFPNRKMDLAIRLLGAETVLTYARRYVV